MPRGEPGLYVQYCAKDFLDGTQMLDPWEELAYRRICDMIYATNDRLSDDDRKLAWMTKVGRRWPAIKAVLTAGDKPKLLIVDGRITNGRCQSALGTAAQNLAQKAMAGRASFATGKSLKNLNTSRTDVLTPVRTDVRTNYLTTKLIEEESKESSSLREQRALRALRARGDPPGFAEWWIAYPHRVSKGQARRAWAGATSKCPVVELIAGVQRYIASKPTDQNWCNPATWLNGERWLDQPTTTTQTGANGHDKRTARENWNIGTAMAVAELLEQDRADADGRDDKPAHGPLLDHE